MRAFLSNFFSVFKRQSWNYHWANRLRTRFIIVLGIAWCRKWLYLRGGDITQYLSHLVGR